MEKVDKKMKILHIHSTMRAGGIESFICQLLDEMQKYIGDISLCTIFEPSSTDIFYNKLADNIHKISLGKKKKGFSLIEIFKIYALIKKGDYDIVHVHGMFYYYVLSVLLLRKNTKFIYTVHSDAYKENQPWDRRLFFLKKFCFRKKFIIPVTISATSQKSFKQLYNCDSKLIYNGVVNNSEKPRYDIIKKYRITENTLIFIHAGRITEAKNQITLCKVFNRLINEGHDIVLLIAGKDESKIIFDQIQQFFSDRIVYLGEIDNVSQFLKVCDAMCLPSIWEGMPIILLEALAAGCIPICSPVGGCNDVIKDGHNGFLSSSSSFEDNYIAVKNFIDLCLTDKLRMKDNVIKSFEQFDIKKCTASYWQLYNSLITNK